MARATMMPREPVPAPSGGSRGHLHRLFAERAKHSSQGRPSGVVISVLLHLTLVAVFVFLPELLREPEPEYEMFSVMVVPPAVLGIENPPPAPPETAPPVPQPAAPPPPAPPAAPKIKTPKKAAVKTPPRRREPPPPSTPARLRKERPPQRKGSPRGNPLGAASSSTALGVEDPNFTYGWYIDQLVNLITSNWTRPMVGKEIKAVFHFRILEDGTVVDLELLQSSGFDEFDGAARRAVETSSPLPPLPRAYKPDFLGVNLIVE